MRFDDLKVGEYYLDDRGHVLCYKELRIAKTSSEIITACFALVGYLDDLELLLSPRAVFFLNESQVNILEEVDICR